MLVANRDDVDTVVVASTCDLGVPPTGRPQLAEKVLELAVGELEELFSKCRHASHWF